MNMNKKAYMLLQMKLWLKKYPLILFVTIITFCVVALLSFAALNQVRNDEDIKKVKIAIVGDIHDTYLGMGVYALQNLDSSRYSVEFIDMSEDEAERALETMEISGYVNVPQDFIKGILRGENKPARYYMQKGAVNFGSIIVGEITGTVSELVTESQTAIYSMQDIARMLGKKQELSKKTKMLNLMCIDSILNRNAMFETEVSGVADSLSLTGYYICSALIFALMLWGISCAGMLSAKNYALGRLVYSRMMGAFGQVMSEYVPFLMVTVVTVLIFSCGAYVFGAMGSNPLSFSLCLLPVILMVTSFHMAVYEIADNAIAAVLFVFMFTIGMGYISGFFYPMAFFPDALQKISSWLPCGLGFSYVRKIFGGGEALGDMVFCLLYFAVFVSLTAAVRKMRLAGDGK